MSGLHSKTGIQPVKQNIILSETLQINETNQIPNQILLIIKANIFLTIHLEHLSNVMGHLWPQSLINVQPFYRMPFFERLDAIFLSDLKVKANIVLMKQKSIFIYENILESNAIYHNMEFKNDLHFLC
jgi:hypothetical protein